MKTYFNEFAGYPAQWLKNYFSGVTVDERSITEVYPTDLRGFTRSHFFAGIGGWEIALQQAGWPEDVPVWTGSCPCQPFSAAGLGKGTTDDRHLWPEFLRLIATCRPPHIFGEQVSGRKVTGKLYPPKAWERLEPEARRAAEEADIEAWFKHVQTDLEREGYIVGHIVFPACGVGAPHLRQRLYWYAQYVADLHQDRQHQRRDGFTEAGGNGSERDCTTGGMGNPPCRRRGEERQDTGRMRTGVKASQDGTGRFGTECSVVELANTNETRHRTSPTERDNRPGPTNGHWRAADWIYCRDDKWRPVEPKSSPLADGISAKSPRGRSELARMARASRKGQLAGYGNAIVIPQAVEFIRACMEEI